MSEKIPADIMAAAREAFAEAMRFNTDHESEEAIARYLLAERRRLAEAYMHWARKMMEEVEKE